MVAAVERGKRARSRGVQSAGLGGGEAGQHGEAEPAHVRRIDLCQRAVTLGGVIAVLALAVRKELLIPVLCGIFLIENLSVIIQVSYFKYTKKKYGEGRRIFLMSPLHHHYQKKNIHEAKIVTRFWIAGVLLAILTLATLKLR